MYETIIEVDTSTDEIMDDISSLDNHQEFAAPPVNFNRARRWSLDVISPRKLFSKREIIPTVPIITNHKPQSPPRRERRFSTPNVKVKGFKFKQSHRLFHHHHHHHEPHRVIRESYLILYLENQDPHVITCDDDEHMKSLLLCAMLDHRVHSYRMIVFSTKAVMKIDAGLARRSRSCENLVESTHDDDEDKDDDDRLTEIDASDARYRIVSDLLETEREYWDAIQTLHSSYAEQLRKLSCLSKGDHDVLFVKIQPLLSLSTSLLQKLKSALGTWDKETTRIGALFPITFWNLYEDYCNNFCEAKRLLETNIAANGTFKEFCETKEEQGTQSLPSLLTLPVTRIVDYGKHLSDLLDDTDPTHPDFTDLSLAVAKVNSMIKDREDELCEVGRPAMDVEQDRSHDSLQLHLPNDNDNNNTVEVAILNNNNNNNEYLSKHKGMSLRRMSAPSALLFKSLAGHKSKSSSSIWSNNSMGRKDHDLISQFKMADGESSRMFVMEGSVQFAAGMQIQERYLFLFNDLLLVTKQKSSTAFKLKHKVQLCDMWLASCIEEVAETTRPADRSFVIGWPTLNVVATFPRPDIKEHWVTKLKEYIEVEKLKDKDKQISLKIAPRDIESVTQKVCQVTINNLTEAKDVLLASLGQLNISDLETKDYQLWVLSGKEGSPYPLIGHETPFSIKLSHFRGLSRSRSGEDIDNMTAADLEAMVTNSSSSGHKCEFYLKQKKSTRKNNYEDSSKSAKKNKKSQNIFHTLFRKRRPAQHLVFGLPLSEVCDENLDPPEAIIRLMVLVYQQGPHIPGILRRGNKATLSKEIREKIDSGDKYTLEDHFAPTAASVFKEFLRSIPEGLLVNDLYAQWTTVKKDDPHGDKINKIKAILAKLPPAHYRMIKLTVSLLQHLAKYSSQNQMGPSNLATCIAPSLYTRGANASSHSSLKGEALKQMNMQDSVSEIQNVIVPLISFMIINHVELFGEDILSIFTKYGCEASPAMNLHEERPEIQMQPSLEEDEEDELVAEEDHEDEMGFRGEHTKKHHRLQLQQQHEQMQRDSTSGTDSDSMHSVLSMQETEMGLRHNDSSIDSLVDREYYLHETESSPKAVKSHISPSNLSRDSGLTLSDTQLYDEEACQGDAVVVPSRLYQRSSSHCADSENMEAYDHISYYPSVGGQLGRYGNPVAPPRKRVTRKGRDSNEESYGEQHGFSTYFRQRVPFNHSLSATQLDINPKMCRSGEMRPLLSHPLLSQRVSSDSIGEEGETLDDQFHPVDFESMRATTDIGTVVKSESGSHLFLSEQAVPVKYSLGVLGDKSQHRFVRQSSVTDSTPPVSPQSRYSQSSRDSAISDSVYSVSQDESIHSTPQTPDELEDKTLTWVPDITIPEKPWAGKLFSHNSNNQFSLPYSKSASDLLSGNTEQNCASTNSSEEQASKVQPSSPKLWSAKFHEAEEIEISSRPYSRRNTPRGYSIDTSPRFSLTSPPRNNPPLTRHGLPAHFDKGSPPPNVIIQTLQSLPRKDSVPFRFNYNSVSPLCESTNKDSFDPIMSSVRLEEYHNVTSKPIIIEPPTESSSSLSSTASRRARLSKYMSSSIDLPLSVKDKDLILSDPKRPDRPPNYQQALERNFIIKHNMPSDKVHAKTLVESGKVDCELRNVKPNDTQSPSINTVSNLLLNKDISYEISPQKVTSNKTNINCAECSILRHSSKDSSSEDCPQNRRTSGYLDMSSLSHSVQKDVLRAESCTGSSGGNSSADARSIALSKSGKHSSMLDTNITTVLPPGNSAIPPKTTPMASTHRSATDFDHRHMAYSRHFSPVIPDDSSQSDQVCEVMEDDRDNENDGAVRKDPQKVYLQSMQIYEQKHSLAEPTSSSPMKKMLASTLSSPFPNNHQQHSSGPTLRSTQKVLPTLSSVDTNATKFSLKPSEKSCLSRCVSAEHLNEFGVYSPLTTKSRHRTLMHEHKMPNTQSDNDIKEKLQPRDIKSELHQNFLRARSCFSQSQTDQQISSAISTQHQTSFQENKLQKLFPRAMSLAPTAEDMTVESAIVPGFRTKMPLKPTNNLHFSTGESKKEINWSVKDLKSIYDKSKDNNNSHSSSDNQQSSSREPSSQPPSQSQPFSSPPYENIQDSSNLNTPTTGSSILPRVSQTSKTVNPHKPQNCVYNSPCSSQDISSSSVNRSSKSGESSHDSEELSDYSNITYV